MIGPIAHDLRGHSPDGADDRDPRYYPLRNHLLDFLVTRSMRYRNGAGNEAARTTAPELPREESAP
jgi:hypothetical protein